jgi:hypothetical protein
LSLAEHVGHLGDEGQFRANGVGVAARRRLAGQVLAQGTEGIGRHEFADLVEFQKVEGVLVHRGEQRFHLGSVSLQHNF